MSQCPRCGALQPPGVFSCSACGFTCAPADWQKWQQLEYILKEIRSWTRLASATRTRIEAPYVAELSTLRERLGLVPAPTPEAIPEAEPAPPKPVPATVSEATPAAAVPAEPAAAAVPEETPAAAAPLPEPVPAPAPEVRERVPIDQWLFSERNIRFMLYVGAFLLVVAAAIFVGARWGEMSPVLKFCIVFFLTGGIYLAGYLLWSIRQMQLAGTVLLAVASAFVPLNFVVLHAGILGPNGVSPTVTWLSASLFGLLLYSLMTFWTRSWVFSLLSVTALVSTAAATLFVLEAGNWVYPLIFLVVVHLLQGLARLVPDTPENAFVRRPALLISHLAAPFLNLATVGFLFAGDYIAEPYPSIWSLFIWTCALSLLLGAGFYLLADLWWKRLAARYVAPVLFTLAVSAGLMALGLDLYDTAWRVTFLLLSAVYLWLGSRLRWRADKLAAGLPLFIVGYLLPIIVTGVAFEQRPNLGYARDVRSLGYILGVDVALLLFSAYLHRSIWWAHGAAWLFVGPFFLFLDQMLGVNETVVAAALLILSTVYLWLGSYLRQRMDGLKFGLPLFIAGYLLPIVITGVAADDLQDLAYILLVDVALLLYSATLHRSIWWVHGAAWLFVGPFFLFLYHVFSVPALALAVAFLVLSAFYLWLGSTLRRRLEGLEFGLPLFVAGYLLPLIFTGAAVVRVGDLITILAGDVALLLFSAYLHRSYWWVYGAVWLFMLPFYLFVDKHVRAPDLQGGYMAILAMNYVIAGYALGRWRNLFYGGPFLSATTLLSVIAPILAWDSPILATFLLVAGASFYLSIALWQRWPGLLLPALLFLNVGLYTTLEISYRTGFVDLIVFAFAYMGMTLALAGAGLAVERNAGFTWAWPIYLFAAIDLVFSYATGVTWNVSAIWLSAVFALVLLSWSWFYRRWEQWGGLPNSILSYIGLLFLFAGHFFAIARFDGWDVSPGITAGFCGAFIAGSWTMWKVKPDAQRLFRDPLRWFGLALIWITPIGALAVGSTIQFAVTLGIIGFFYGVDGFLHRRAAMGYLAGAAILGAYWGALVGLGVPEAQAYVLPPAVACFTVGWLERRRGLLWLCRLLSWVALAALLGTSFVQSVTASAAQWVYLILVLVEALLAFFGGMRIRSKVFVVAGIATMIIVAFAQWWGQIVAFGWPLLGAVGAFLLSLGIAALYRREQIVRVGRALADTWRRWDL